MCRSRLVVAAVLLAGSQVSQATVVYADDLGWLPLDLKAGQTVTFTVSGDLANPNYAFTGGPDVEDLAGTLAIRFDLTDLTPGGVDPEILEPFSVDAEVAGLAAGDYEVQVNFFVDGDWDAHIDGRLSVAAVPVPATLGLFVSGMLGITGLGLGRRRRPAVPPCG